MRVLISALPAYLRLSLATMMQYRGEIVLWAIWGVVYPAVAIAMWSAAAGGRASGNEIHGYAASQFAAYFLMTMIVGHICTAWDVYDMGYQVRTGAMSPKLLRPILPVWERVADNIAYKLLTLVILVPIWLLIAWLTGPAFETSREGFLLSIPAVLFAAVLSFLWSYILGLLAFWITRMEAVGEMWFGAGLLFGGGLAPLTILPEPLQVIAAGLPFKWMIWFPSAALTGKIAPAEIGPGLLIQVVWIAVALVVFRLAWRVGVKRYSAVGA